MMFATPTPAPTANPTAILALLQEEDVTLQDAALKKLNDLVAFVWHEVAEHLPHLETLISTSNPKTSKLAARLASQVYYYLEEHDEALRLALLNADTLDLKGSSSPYVSALIRAAIARYISYSKDYDDLSTKKEELKQLDPLIVVMFERCFADGTYEQALGIALEACDIQRVNQCFDQASANKLALANLLSYGIKVCRSYTGRKFRSQVLQTFCSFFRLLENQKDQNLNYNEYVTVLHLMDDAAGVGRILVDLLDSENENDALLAYQLVFDVTETGDAGFCNRLVDALPKKEEESATTTTTTTHKWERYEQVQKVLVGGLASDLSLQFLYKNSDSDPLIMENIRKSVEGRNSVLHHGSVMVNAYLNAGTTNDGFLRNNFEWMQKATQWARFSTTASLGVIHAGHTTEAMSLLEPYFPGDGAGTNTRGGFENGGSLYALGLINSNAGVSAEKRKEVLEFLREHLRSSHANEPISHGAALGVGLASFGSRDLAVIEELKELLFTDSAVSGEAAGIALGLVMVGSGGSGEQLSEVVSELKNYARETQHEKIIRGISMGLAVTFFGQEEVADSTIEEMKADRDPILRYGAQYTLALAYCGTGSNKAIRQLLHTAISDASDDVRMASVIGLAFVLYQTPERVPQLVKLLLESYNAHVRYASCMSVGIAMAGSGDLESIALLEPMIDDVTDFVRQGALVGIAMILMQQSESNKKVKSFREKLASISNDKHLSTLTKLGAIIATGIIDAGGRNCSLSLGSSSGFTKVNSAVGLALWLQHWHWYPMFHMFSLALTPTFVFGLNKDFNFPKSFELECNAKPSLFAYPKRLEEKKEEKKKRVETVTLSTTAKSKAREARKKAKGSDDAMDLEEATTAAATTTTQEDTNDESKPDKVESVVMEVDSKEKKKKKQREPSSFRISNPSRVTSSQIQHLEFDTEQRYIPVDMNRKPFGVMVLRDCTPDELEDVGKIKAPSAENEADPPEAFEWAPPGHADYIEPKDLTIGGSDGENKDDCSKKEEKDVKMSDDKKESESDDAMGDTSEEQKHTK